MYFIDRQEAGLRLAQMLKQYRGTDAVVYAIPRSGVPVGVALAEELNLPFDLAVVSRIEDPTFPGRAVGAMTSSGELLFNEGRRDGLNAGWLTWAVMFAKRDIERKQHLSQFRRHYSARGKVAIVVDDGATTGITLRAALQTLKEEVPRKIILALPVIDYNALVALSDYVNQIIALEESDTADEPIARHYGDRHALSDREVGYMLQQYDTFMQVTGGAA